MSKPGGKVSIEWGKPSDGNPGAMLKIDWREIGGPPVTPQTRSGFGTSLIRDLIPHELGGTIDLGFNTEGVCCAIGVPLNRL